MSSPYNFHKYSWHQLKEEFDSRQNKKASQKTSELSSIPPMNIIRGINEQQKVLYGVDDRKDLYEVYNERYLKAADSVVALFKKNQIIDIGDGRSKLKLTKFGKKYKLCSDEKFREQPTGAFCSGFLVKPNLIATAGHCVNKDGSDLEEIRFVFGFKMNGPGNPTTKINNSEIYKGTKIIGWDKNDEGADWALIRLDRSVKNHSPVRVRKEGKIELGSSLYVIGCPCGLPMKFADGAQVRENSKDTHMVCNLDTYGGNSGSPVFSDKIDDSESPLVEGILVRGERDFTQVGNCNVSFVCPKTVCPKTGSRLNCIGEEVTRTTVFANRIDSE